MIQKRKNVRNKRNATKRTRAAHLKASLTYVAPHRHTGRRLRTRHTSHGFLLILLIVAGIILFMNLANLRANGLTSSGEVNVTLTVPGPAPTRGAEITSIQDKSTVTKPLLVVEGTCPSGTIVAIYNDGLSAGSTVCTTSDTFSITINLHLGMNVLQAQNYDSLNQPGPTTAQVQVNFEPDSTVVATEVNTAADITLDPSLPDVLAPPPSDNPCYEQFDPEATTELTLVVPCITRNVFIGQKIELPVHILGGFSPYALSVNWGDSDTAKLYSLPTSGRHALSYTYSTPLFKNITLNIADARGQSYQMSTIVEVNNNTSAVTGATPLQNAVNNLSDFWFNASVPIYWAAVSLFLGFWVGDLFQRFLGLRKPIRRHS
jgi:hypothetical protein